MNHPSTPVKTPDFPLNYINNEDEFRVFESPHSHFFEFKTRCRDSLHLGLHGWELNQLLIYRDPAYPAEFFRSGQGTSTGRADSWDYRCRHRLGGDRIRYRNGGYGHDWGAAGTTELPVRVQRCTAHGTTWRLILNRCRGHRLRRRRGGKGGWWRRGLRDDGKWSLRFRLRRIKLGRSAVPAEFRVWLDTLTTFRAKRHDRSHTNWLSAVNKEHFVCHVCPATLQIFYTLGVTPPRGFLPASPALLSRSPSRHQGTSGTACLYR